MRITPPHRHQLRAEHTTILSWLSPIQRSTSIPSFPSLQTARSRREMSRLRTLCLILMGTTDSNEKATHRHIFSRLDNEIIPIDDPNTMKLICQMFRLQFLKDQPLSRFMRGKVGGVVHRSDQIQVP
ncbi:MAG: hypothetical protein JOS17DRAFT_817051 [Linnemannia elongata]|nr:MAG: hypothetical protein JOS17DRAFT_817051 [Linnemannia elongata]